MLELSRSWASLIVETPNSSWQISAEVRIVTLLLYWNPVFRKVGKVKTAGDDKIHLGIDHSIIYSSRVIVLGTGDGVYCLLCSEESILPLLTCSCQPSTIDRSLFQPYQFRNYRFSDGRLQQGGTVATQNRKKFSTGRTRTYTPRASSSRNSKSR